jgi:OmpA-OmpF porin, OOP family
MDLLGLVKDQLTSAAVGKISEFLGESSENTQSAVSAAVPTLLGGLMEKASTTDGAGSLLNLLKDGGHDGGLLGNLGSLLGSGDGISSILGGGSGILSSILGPKVGGIVDLIASVSGIKKSSSSSLLSLAAPILMGVLGKQVSSQGLGISGLANLLMGQKDAVKAALPKGADSILNVAGLGDFLGGGAKHEATSHDSSRSASAHTSHEEADTSGGGFNFWPWLIGLALAGLAFYFLRGCNGSKSSDGSDSLSVAVSDSLSAAVGAVGDSAMAIGDSAAALAGAAGTAVADFSKKLSSGFEIKASSTGIESQLISFVEDAGKAVDKTTWFNFDGINFDTGKSTIKAESQAQITNIAEILKAYPAVKLKIGGYTDNVGNEASNQKLSTDRANAVKAALVALGTDGARLDAEGYGSQHPVASNDTDEGRAQNRRMAARVTAK